MICAVHKKKIKAKSLMYLLHCCRGGSVDCGAEGEREMDRPLIFPGGIAAEQVAVSQQSADALDVTPSLVSKCFLPGTLLTVQPYNTIALNAAEFIFIPRS